MFKVKGNTSKGLWAQTRATKSVIVLVAMATFVTACGIPNEATISNRDVVAAVSDPGPAWQPSARVDDTKVQSFGVFEGPSHMPNYGLLSEFVGVESGFGVFAGPQWAVNQSALDQALGIDRDAGIPGDSEPVGHPQLRPTRDIPRPRNRHVNRAPLVRTERVR